MIAQNLAKHIGWNVVAYGTKRQLEILQSSSGDEGAAFPAQSITISHADAIKNLRDFCDEILKQEEVIL